MHVAQKKAILALLSMVEAGLREIRAAVSDGEEFHVEHATAARAHYQQAPAAPHVPDGVLSEDDESTLEQVMEKHRQELLAAAGNLAANYYDDAPPGLSSFFEEDDR